MEDEFASIAMMLIPVWNALMELMKKMSKIHIPTCCGFALKDDMSVPGKEYVCPTCNTYYEEFDDYALWQSSLTMTVEQKKVAKERGWQV